MDAAVYEDLSHLERVSSNRFDDNPCFKVDEILRSLQDIDRRVQTRANQLLAERSPSLQRLSSVSAPDRPDKTKPSDSKPVDIIQLSHKPKKAKELSSSQCVFVANQLRAVQAFLNENLSDCVKDKNENVAFLESVIKTLTARV